MADQLTEATQRLQAMLTEAFGTRHPAIDDWAVILFAVKDAQRYRWLQENRLETPDDFSQGGQLYFGTFANERDWMGESLSAAIDAAMREKPAGVSCEQTSETKENGNA